MKLSAEELLLDWYNRVRFAQFAHYETAKTYDRLNYWLGVPVVILSTLVGTSVFANIGKLVDEKIQISIGLTSVLAATLASLQTFFRFSEKAEKHRISASKYGALRREIEEDLVSLEGFDRDEVKKVTEMIRHKLDKLSDESLHIPHNIWSKRQKVIEDDHNRFVGLLGDKIRE